MSPPPWASSLIKTLEACTGMPGNREWINDSQSNLRTPDEPYMFGGVSNNSPSSSPKSFFSRKKSATTAFPPPSWGHATDSGSYFTEAPPKPQHVRSKTWDNYRFDAPGQLDSNDGPRKSYRQSSRTDSTIFSEGDYRSQLSRSTSLKSAISDVRPYSTFIDDTPGSGAPYAKSYPASIDKPLIQPRMELLVPLPPSEGVARAIALFDFTATQESIQAFSCGYYLTFFPIGGGPVVQKR